jgi:hypothetical protein
LPDFYNVLSVKSFVDSGATRSFYFETEVKSTPDFHCASATRPAELRRLEEPAISATIISHPDVQHLPS